jgi:hypothetical protein
MGYLILVPDNKQRHISFLKTRDHASAYASRSATQIFRNQQSKLITDNDKISRVYSHSDLIKLIPARKMYNAGQTYDFSAIDGLSKYSFVYSRHI